MVQGNSISPLQKLREQYIPQLPDLLTDLRSLVLIPEARDPINPSIQPLFPHLSRLPAFVRCCIEKSQRTHLAKRVGVVLSGGQAAGGHNVIAGLYDALRTLHPDSVLFGFLNGPKGILDQKYISITEELLIPYRNQGGFDLIGSGRTKIETVEQFKDAMQAMNNLKLDALVVIGGDDSNTNAALLAEYFLANHCQTTVIGVPKTIDGDLRNEDIPTSFGFDSAAKTFSEIIGNIARDALSAKKSYYFIKLMGRSASHLVLECALQTCPNMTLVGEEVAEQRKTVAQLTTDLADLICNRSKAGKEYGIVLIPEGIIEFIPECQKLVGALNELFVTDHTLETLPKEKRLVYVKEHLQSDLAATFSEFPTEIQMQLLLDRDPHGNVQVSKIETERLFMELVKRELAVRKAAGVYRGSFSAQPYFCGYEGRSCLPSNFDAQYCYALGYMAALLVDQKATGMICCIQNLTQPANQWRAGARNLVSMLSLENRKGQLKPVITKALVDLNGSLFTSFVMQRKEWMIEDHYRNPGPIQFFGPKEITDSISYSLRSYERVS